MRNWLIHTLGVLFVAGTAGAEDGKVLFETYCGACHAPDGKGMNNGQFPPLAGSPWVQGKPDRMVQAVLHGMEGPIEVGDKEYDLVMPPQGVMLNDEQLSKIVTYVRGSFGNAESAVTPAEIAAQRAATAGRAEMWPSVELLKRYPLPGETDGPSAIKNLVANIYHGDFKSLADLAKVKAKPTAVEEEQDGLLRIDKVGRADGFGIVWEGDLEVPKDGDFTFLMDSDEGSGLYIDGKQVAVLDRLGAVGNAVKGSVKLTKGTHKIRVAYFENTGEEEFSLGWSGPGLPGGLNWLTPRVKKAKGKKNPGYPSIPIVAPKGEATIYRNFIEGTTARGIGVGYDGGVNLAFSADNMAVELIWTGQFMDGGRHWTNRGQGRAAPAGVRVLQVSKGPAFAVLESGTTPWPGAYEEGLKPHFRGYVFNAQQEPTFFYTLGPLEVTDSPAPVPEGPALKRTINIAAGEDGPKNLCFRVVEGWPMTELASHRFDIAGQAVVEISQAGTGKPFLRNGTELIVPLILKKGDNTITLTYTWN